jgi:hypothetical protein
MQDSRRGEELVGQFASMTAVVTAEVGTGALSAAMASSSLPR